MRPIDKIEGISTEWTVLRVRKTCRVKHAFERGRLESQWETSNWNLEDRYCPQNMLSFGLLGWGVKSASSQVDQRMCVWLELKQVIRVGSAREGWR